MMSPRSNRGVNLRSSRRQKLRAVQISDRPRSGPCAAATKAHLTHRVATISLRFHNLIATTHCSSTQPAYRHSQLTGEHPRRSPSRLSR